MRPYLLPAWLLLCSASCSAQVSSLDANLKWLTETPAVSGYEAPLADRLEKQLASLHPHRDRAGNITLTFGSGAPHRLIAAPVDEPGYVVSKIDDDGYLRVARLPQAGLPPHYNEMLNAQPMLVTTRDGRSLSAVVAGLSIHLQPGRAGAPDPDDLDNMYIDLGARTKADVLNSGVDVLSPLATERSLTPVGQHQWAGTAVGDRFGAAILLEIVQALSHTTPTGTVTLAFVTQQWTGSRGLLRTLEQFHPDELLYLGRGNKPVSRNRSQADQPIEVPSLGSGVVLHLAADRATDEEISWLTTDNPHVVPAGPILMRGYGPATTTPKHTAHLSIPILYPLTAGETIDDRDLTSLLRLVSKHLGIDVAAKSDQQRAAIPYDPPRPKPATIPSNETLLKTLTTTYGVSEQETITREAVEHLLPRWAHPHTDDAGNLILHLGPSSGPGIVFMAHTDELGFRVRAIKADGSLELDNKGGGTTSFFWGHPAVVHTAGGMRGGIISLPPNFDTAQFRFPTDFRAPATMTVGASSAAEVGELGIKAGDSVTILKRFHSLLNGRVSVRSLDDRVGCAALVHAVWELGEEFQRNVTFVWSTREELGLLGAAAYAASAAKTASIPATIFAIDTFVSSDSPLESHRFADSILGDGFVVRAIDSSNIVLWSDVQRVQSIAKTHNIPVQYGVTGGGNDGAVFQRYGTTDVALSWPLRNSHSPGEVMDLRDLDALSKIVAALAHEWPMQ